MYICMHVWTCIHVCLGIRVLHAYAFFHAATLKQQNFSSGICLRQWSEFCSVFLSESNQSQYLETTINYFLNQKGPLLTYSPLNMTIDLKTKNKQNEKKCNVLLVFLRWILSWMHQEKFSVSISNYLGLRIKWAHKPHKSTKAQRLSPVLSPKPDLGGKFSLEHR